MGLITKQRPDNLLILSRSGAVTSVPFVRMGTVMPVEKVSMAFVATNPLGSYKDGRPAVIATDERVALLAMPWDTNRNDASDATLNQALRERNKRVKAGEVVEKGALGRFAEVKFQTRMVWVLIILIGLVIIPVHGPAFFEWVGQILPGASTAAEVAG